MIRNNDRISNYQLAMVIITTSIGIGIFSLPSDVVQYAGTDSWLIVLLSGLLNAVIAMLMVKLCAMFPQKSFPEYSRIILGKFLGNLVTAIFALLSIYSAGLVLRSFTEILNLFIMFRTPAIVIMVTFMLVCAYLVKGGVEVIGRFLEIIFLLLFLPFGILILLGLRQADMTNLLPILYHFPQNMTHIVPMILFSLGGYQVTLYFAAYLKNPAKAYRSVVLAVAFTALFTAFAVGACVAKFGTKLTAQMTWPLIHFIRGSNVTGIFMESLDGVLILLWTFLVFTTIVTNYYIASLSASKIFHINMQRKLVIPIGILIILAALSVQNISHLFDRLRGARMAEVLVLIDAIPILLFLVAKVRRLGGGEVNDGQAKRSH